jgi:carboxymethylenebutenolidase
MTGAMVQLRAADGHEFRAYVVEPTAPGNGNAIVLLHEIFGINSYMRTMAAEFAATGLTAVVPDLFARQERDVELGYHGEEFEHAIELRNGLDFDLVLDDIRAAMEWASSRPGNGGKVGLLGYCLGGGLAFLAASALDPACAVSYYGVGVQDRIERASGVRCPILFHLAENDHYCPPEARAVIEDAFARNSAAEFHLYPGTPHAFATYRRNTFDQLATDLAWDRTTTFLKDHL